MNYTREREPLNHFHEHVNVIRHNAPSNQSIAATIEMEERILSDSRNRRYAKVAAAHALVEPGFNAFSRLDLGFASQEANQLSTPCF